MGFLALVSGLAIGSALDDSRSRDRLILFLSGRCVELTSLVVKRIVLGGRTFPHEGVLRSQTGLLPEIDVLLMKPLRSCWVDDPIRATVTVRDFSAILYHYIGERKSDVQRRNVSGEENMGEEEAQVRFEASPVQSADPGRLISCVSLLAELMALYH